MTMSNQPQMPAGPYLAVDREVVEAAMARARRERAVAFDALLRSIGRLISRPFRPERTSTTPTQVCAGPASAL